MSEPFEASYELDDGYAGNRPRHFSIYPDEIDDDMDQEALREYYQGAVQSDFEQSVFPIPKDEDEFVAWGLAVLAERKAYKV